MTAALIGIALGWVLVQLLIFGGYAAMCLYERYDQAGRKGHGFEHTASRRVRTAVALWWVYDVKGAW